MVDHHTSAQRRQALTRHVQGLLISGELSPGAPLPPLRTLSTEFGLSTPTILDELGPLIAAGRLVSVPRVGIFAGSATTSVRPRFLFVQPSFRTALARQHGSAMRIGFEETVSELGGVCIPLTFDDLERIGDLPAMAAHLAGVAAWSTLDEEQLGLANLPIPQVRIGRYPTADGVDTDTFDTDAFDTVRFDDVGGGRLAVEYLLQHGHTAIAFLGLHPGSSVTDPNHAYSVERLEGWRHALRQAHLDDAGLAFALDRPVPHYPTARAAAHAAAQTMIPLRDRFTAVVGADDHAVLGLVDAYREHRIPYDQWPALVGFEGTLDAEQFVSSSILPQWHELGEQSAHVLWQRHHHRLTGDPVTRWAGMKLMARMTSSAAWPIDMPHALSEVLFAEVAPPTH